MVNNPKLDLIKNVDLVLNHEKLMLSTPSRGQINAEDKGKILSLYLRIQSSYHLCEDVAHYGEGGDIQNQKHLCLLLLTNSPERARHPCYLSPA